MKNESRNKNAHADQREKKKKKKSQILQFFISTKQQHRPAFSQNVWNFTSESEFSCT